LVSASSDPSVPWRGLRKQTHIIETVAVDQDFLDDDQIAEVLVLLSISCVLPGCMMSANVKEMI
jgi:hypothetical protein